jgi:hypothetical protein
MIRAFARKRPVRASTRCASSRRPTTHIQAAAETPAMQVVKGRVMPRPCQKRRARVAAQRSANAKPAPPKPPPKPKANHNGVQKSNSKSNRGRNNNYRGRGGRNSRQGPPGRPGLDMNDADFIPFASGGFQFSALRDTGSRHNPIALDEDDLDLEDGDLMTDDGSDMDGISDELDTGSEDDMMINVEVDHVYKRPSRPAIMFTALEAVSVYDSIYQAGFPLLPRKVGRFGPKGEIMEVVQTTHTYETYNAPTSARNKPKIPGDHSTRSSTYASLTPFPRSNQPNTEHAAQKAPKFKPEPHDQVRDYVFDWGRYKNCHILDVPEGYLRTIAGQSFVFDGRHPGLKEAFDFHRPGARHPSTNQQPPAQAPVQAPRRGATKQQIPTQAPAQASRRSKPTQGPSPSERFQFPKGSWKDHRLDQVPENYLRTLEGMPIVIQSWRGLKEALDDFNEKTGRQSKVVSAPAPDMRASVESVHGH